MDIANNAETLIPMSTPARVLFIHFLD